MSGSAADDKPSGDAQARRPPLGVLFRSNLAAILVSTLVLIAVAVVAVEDRSLVVALVLSTPCVAGAAVIDARLQLIPTSLTMVASGLGLTVLASASIWTGDATSFGRAVAAAVIVGVLYLGLWRFAGMGLGDVRLAAALGLYAGWVGWPAVLMFFVLPFLITLPVALWRIARGHRDHVAFGPAIVAGLYIAVAFAPAAA